MIKKPKLKYDNILLVIFVSIFILVSIITAVMAIKTLKKFKGKSTTPTVTEVVDQMKVHGYQLKQNNTKYFEKLYYELKELLNDRKSENFEEEYAKLVAQLFVADFYDLDSKLDKTDVGGVQFILESHRETFKNFATDSKGIYYYVENNIDGKRTQKLPSVKEVTVKNIESIHYSKENVEDMKAYRVTLSISYKEDLSYPSTCTVTLLHNQEKLEIIAVE